MTSTSAKLREVLKCAQGTDFPATTLKVVASALRELIPEVEELEKRPEPVDPREVLQDAADRARVQLVKLSLDMAAKLHAGAAAVERRLGE